MRCIRLTDYELYEGKDVCLRFPEEMVHIPQQDEDGSYLQVDLNFKAARIIADALLYASNRGDQTSPTT